MFENIIAFDMDLEDFIVSNNLLPLGSLGYVLFCTRKNGWGWERFLAETNAGEGLAFSRVKGLCGLWDSADHHVHLSERVLRQVPGGGPLVLFLLFVFWWVVKCENLKTTQNNINPQKYQ